LIGGSSLGYNCDGIDYNGTGGVEPSDKITGFNGFTSAVTGAQVTNEDLNIYSVDEKLVLHRYAGKTINIGTLSKGIYILGLILQKSKTSSVKCTTE
tara:strand:- start:12720 stop:13010 length:291 start_codon:yes stop_codon:yes gene_type:complete